MAQSYIIQIPQVKTGHGEALCAVRPRQRAPHLGAGGELQPLRHGQGGARRRKVRNTSLLPYNKIWSLSTPAQSKERKGSNFAV